MNSTSLILIAALLSGCVMLEHGHGLKGGEKEYWKADGTSYGFNGDEPIEGPDYVCFGTYAGCEHAFNLLPVSTTHHEPPAPLIEPNSNLAPPMEGLPGQ